MNQQEKFAQLLETKTSGKITANTFISVGSNGYTVRYHSTDIVSVMGDTVVLFANGPRNATNKKKINMFQDSARVYPKNGDWYIETANHARYQWPENMHAIITPMGVEFQEFNPLKAVKVADIPQSYELVTDSQDVAMLHPHSISDEYRAYFVRAENGSIVELFGLFSIAPKLYDTAENALARYMVGVYSDSIGYLPDSMELFACWADAEAHYEELYARFKDDYEIDGIPMPILTIEETIR